MGKRAGRGRPTEITNGVDMGIRFSAAMIERLDRLADKIGISRAQMIRNLLEVALDDAELLDGVGAFTLAKWFEAMREGMRERRDHVLQAT